MQLVNTQERNWCFQLTFKMLINYLIIKNIFALTLEEPSISECISVCLKECSILTLELNISAADQLIQLKCGTLINLRM